MSKKDFQAIAAAIYGSRSRLYEDPDAAMDAVVEAIGDALYATNPRFDRARFLEACETGKCREDTERTAGRRCTGLAFIGPFESMEAADAQAARWNRGEA